MSWNKRWLKSPKMWSSLAIIILAAVLLELISAAQYHYSHRMLENELDLRAESELTLKSVRVKSILHSHETMTHNYLWSIQQQLDHPASIFNITHRIVSINDDVMSSFVAFVPGFYPAQGTLFEPASYRLGDSIVSRQLACATHDYRQRAFYHQAVENGISEWCDPYMDYSASGQQVTTFAVPLTDEAGKTVGAFGIDLSTQGIIDTLNTRHNDPSTFFSAAHRGRPAHLST